MGIYLFERDALEALLLDPAQLDFGKHVIPKMLGERHVQAYRHDGYWEDVGTIRSYYEANLALTDREPAFSFYDPARPIYTHPRFLAPTKVHDSRIDDALIADGCYVDRAEITRSVLGVRTIVLAGARIRRSLVLGADGYDPAAPAQAGTVPLGIGEGTVIENAIVDKNARIGRNVRLVNERGIAEADGPCWFIREGLVIVPKDAVVPDGTVV